MRNNWLTAAALAAIIAAPGTVLAQSSQSGSNQSGSNQSGSNQSGSNQDAYRRAETPGRAAVPNSDVDYNRSMERLFQASQRLREAVQAMAQQPVGEHRKQAINSANQALLETQQAMVQASAIGQSSTAGGSASSAQSGSSTSGSQSSRGSSSSSGSSGGSQSANSGSSGSSK